MPEDVLFDSENRQSRAEVASYLRTFADKLDGDGPITLTAGGQSVTIDPPEQPTFEVKAEREGPADAPGELSVEFEIEWDEEQSGESAESSELSIE
ncbi:amphi-Trp domain-containing protein [Halobellus salinus]|uniref:Amphi-Trp domain-containing protein n=1 Tax=Halobellus salinus TaxID=931585 RepID=A0A830ET35_9EURY|nr:amphi-Trp domain-containing protein [Halobellus salinus]GGJ07119.1 amphi-Trp domain-containing protein [Halobellus salinus]SMP25685.1 amphi-Trp domain-containing protein [Halobellus salinus]